MKPFTVDLAHKHYKHSFGPFVPGDRVKVSKYFTGGDESEPAFTSGTVVDIENNTDYEVADWLKVEGYTNHSVYKVKFDNGIEMVIWPNEIMPEKD